MILENAKFSYKKNHHQAIKKVEYLIDYNTSHAEKFDGLHIDVEPYTLASWQNGNYQKQNKILKQYNNLLKKIKLKILNQDLMFSEDLPWWYNEQAEKGNLPRADASIQRQYVDFAVLMCYGGIGESGSEIVSLVADEIKEMPIIVGFGIDEFSDNTKLFNAVKKVKNHFSNTSNYLGSSIFYYSTLFD